MVTVSMSDAELNLSGLVEAVESGAEKEIVITRDGRPVARLVPAVQKTTGQRIGVALDKFRAPEPNATLDAEIGGTFVAPQSREGTVNSRTLCSAPVPPQSLLALLTTLPPLGEDFPQIDDLPPESVDL